MKAPEGPLPEDPFEQTAKSSGKGGKGTPQKPQQIVSQQQQAQQKPQQQKPQLQQPQPVASNSSGDLAAMPFDTLPLSLQVIIMLASSTTDLQCQHNDIGAMPAADRLGNEP